jgi:hypothetical protein
MFHSWFQSTHNIRMGIVEGGHHCETAMRIFYGYKIGQDVPLTHKTDFNPVNENSTLVQPFSIKLVHPEAKHHLVTAELVAKLKDYSEAIQTQRQQLVEATYKQLWNQIYLDCAKVVAKSRYKGVFEPMTQEELTKMEFEKKTKDDIVSAFIEDIKTAVIDRYWEMEPGKTEVKKLEKETFLELVHKGKTIGRNFHGIREVSGAPCRGTHSSAIYLRVLHHQRHSKRMGC